MTRKLTDEELANVRTFVPAECVGLLMYVDLMTAEIRSLRAAPVISEEEREGLTEMLVEMRFDLPDRYELALAVLDRLLSAGKETL